MPTWPSTLPQDFQLRGFKETFPKDALYSQIERSTANKRERSSSNPRPFSLQLFMDSQQLTDFLNFYENTIGSGSLRFTHVDPRTREEAVLKFADEEPVITAFSNDKFKVSVNLLVLR